MRTRTKIFITLGLLFGSGFLIPEPTIIPVKDATKNNWHPKTFWFEPWGSSVTHKGIDIFSDKGTPILASSHLLILYKGNISKGGKVILALGPKWRLHYFAHLDSFNKSTGTWVKVGTEIGTVGDTGNAKGKPPHLHYSLISLIPLPWLIDGSTQGYKKAFYLNPIHYFNSP